VENQYCTERCYLDPIVMIRKVLRVRWEICAFSALLPSVKRCGMSVQKSVEFEVPQRAVQVKLSLGIKVSLNTEVQKTLPKNFITLPPSGTRGWWLTVHRKRAEVQISPLPDAFDLDELAVDELLRSNHRSSSVSLNHLSQQGGSSLFFLWS
jgi:hypothetical protein